MPNRILKESICTSETIEGLSPEEEIFFYRLIVNCDDYGRMDGRSAVIRSRCFPLRLDRVTEDDVERWLGKLRDANLVKLYVVDGKRYLQIITWDKHQQIRAKRSKYPAPQSDCENLISDDIKRNQPKSDDGICPRNPNPNPNPNPNKESTTDSTTYEDVPTPPEKEPPASPPVHIPNLEKILNEMVRTYYEKWPDERKKYKVAGVVTARKVFEQGLTGADGDDPIDPDRLMQQIVNWPDIIPPTPWDVVKACRAGPWEQSWADINASINEFLAKERERHANPRDAP